MLGNATTKNENKATNPIVVPDDAMNEVEDIDNAEHGGSDVVDVLDELEMHEGGGDDVDLDEVDGDQFDIEDGINGDSSFLCDHLHTHAMTEGIMGHEPDVPKKCIVLKTETVADFDDIDALDRL